MMIAGIQVNDGQVTTLAERLERAGSIDTAGKLRRATFVMAVSVRLEVFQQRELIAALETDCPQSLIPLRDALVRRESLRAHRPSAG